MNTNTPHLTIQLNSGDKSWKQTEPTSEILLPDHQDSDLPGAVEYNAHCDFSIPVLFERNAEKRPCDENED